MQGNAKNIIMAGKGSKANLDAALIYARAHNHYLGSLLDQVEEPEGSGAPIVAELAELVVNLDDYPEEPEEEEVLGEAENEAGADEEADASLA